MPAGTYTVVLKNGNFPGKTISIPAAVAEGASAKCAGSFATIDAAAYFEREGWRR